MFIFTLSDIANAIFIGLVLLGAAVFFAWVKLTEWRRHRAMRARRG